MIPSTYFQSVALNVDNGSDHLIPVTQTVLLPLQLQTCNIATEWLVVPQLAAPLDALISWSWGIKLQLTIDFAANEILWKHKPPASCCVPSDFRQLVLTASEPLSEHQASTPLA